ncbi:MAG TPA: STAS/SEC14 domain-containing protein [Alphaproteobacteria bacterium]|nr:STAS/SEC14 domain-containing protein [Alphaproteobacteria bacterium]
MNKLIEIIPEEKKKLIHFKCEGVITHEDYQKVLIPTLENEIGKEGPLRIYCDMREMTKIKGKAIWDDYKFGIHHLKDFDRIATVGDQWWMSPLMSISSLFFKTKLKHFKGDKFEEAWKWVNR